jgi:DNA-directed RNA polymerase subunit RPC12/RpoP
MSTLVGLMPGVPQNSTFETVVQVRGKVPVASILSDRIAQKPNESLQKRQGNKGRVHPKCLHGKRQTICLLCNGGSLCVHGKQRHWCVTCGGSALCVHKKQKSRCVHCGGSAICRHGNVRYKCSDCKTNTNQE